VGTSAQGEAGINERVVTLSHGLQVRVIDEGTGPIVLLLHGNPDNADEYVPLIRLLRKDFRCIAPDLPGYGRRGKSYALPEAYDYTLKAQVTFVDEVLKALQVDEKAKMTLVVHDIGGIMGVPWAAQNTSRLKAMVYTNTVAFPKFHWFPLARFFGSSGVLGKPLAAANMSLIGWVGGSIFRGQFAKQNPQLDANQIERFVTDFALNDIAKETTLRQFREITKLEFFDNYDVMVKTISRDVPSLTLWGDKDPYLPDSGYAEQLFARKTVILPDIGHWVPITAAERLAEGIRSLQ
jgi:pimeloyl-ACP methyl ester carboxylesterase